ncbi:MAG: hypothetical protein QOC81_134 [Thermoanaerobaculia bacterium]|jgi:hypothetical protein|nr:hypothetical protein [Thermoanaerobaculia bacterium]
MTTLTRGTIRRYVFAAALVCAAVTRPVAAQDLNHFERVLLPVSVSRIPGAFGTLWSTELWYRNNSTRPVAIYPLAMSDHVPTMNRTELLPVFTSPNYDPSQIINVERNGIDDIQFDLRLFNRSDPRAKFGTKIPVVREHEFADAISLINIPTAADFRSALRIYALPDDSVTGETVLLQIFSNDERLLVSTEIPFVGVPRYAVVSSLADAYPAIRQVDRVRVHVASTSGRKIWAFAGVTSNTTQDVSIVTPD